MLYSMNITNKPLHADDGFLSQDETVAIIDKVMRTLKDVVYYAMVENRRARDVSLTTAKEQLEALRDAIDMSDSNPVAVNLQNLFQFMIYSLSTVPKHNNPSAALECIAMLEPIREAMQ